MVIAYSTPELLSIGESVLAMHPHDWLAQQQQINELLDEQSSYFQRNKTTQFKNNNNLSYVDNSPDSYDVQHEFLNRFLIMNQLNNFNGVQEVNNFIPKPAQSRSMTADSLLRDFVQFQQKFGAAKTQDPFTAFTEPPISDKDIIMARFQNKDSHNHPQLTDSVADFFRKAQQIFRPNNTIGVSDPAAIYISQPNRVRRLSDVEAELIAHRNPTSSSRDLEMKNDD